jgi:DNA mismatch repair ATPase MutS
MCKGGKPTIFRKQYYPPLMGKEHVKNTFDLSNNAIITGPNASGKTTMLKTTTINEIFSQQYWVGFYQSCDMTAYTHIHSYLNIPDTSGRDSLFQAESRRCKEIIDIIQTPYEKNTSQKARHFAIFDELYSGTNPTEATQSAYAFLLYLSKFQNVDYILTTHYVSLCKKLEKQLMKKENLAPVMNYKMDVVIHPESGKVKYTYVMKRGISKIQGAVLILEEMSYPKEILDEMRKIKME